MGATRIQGRDVKAGMQIWTSRYGMGAVKAPHLVTGVAPGPRNGYIVITVDGLDNGDTDVWVKANTPVLLFPSA